eukprot:Opistho-2@29554
MASAQSTAPIEREILPTTVTPSKYALQLHVHLDRFEFDGTVEITAQVHAATHDIIVHAVDLDLKSAVVHAQVLKNATEISAESINVDKASERAVLHFPHEIAPGSIMLRVHFSGKLSDALVGFYRSRYTVKVDGKDEERHLATTQFEATDARRCFPCWDEPAVKAVFEVELVIPNALTALSNMPVVDEGAFDAGRKIVKFAPTPVMSTYLLAFAVGEFEYIERKTKEGVLIRSYTTPGKKEQGQFALDVAVDSLSYFGEYFDSHYPLPKLDMIAIPDFAAGAMENWGLVTYREISILADPVNTSVSTKQNIAITVAHELAHQWFGNLVTMSWWSDLWLNEGFATWISYLAVDILFPDWQIWTQFAYADLGNALRLDSLITSHPIEVEVKSSGEINEIFDSISYSKGSAVIRMLAAFLGDADFKSGLRLYLRRHKYANACTADLWKALEEVSGKPVGEVMNRYTKQTGYPVLTIAVDDSHVSANGCSRCFKLRQSRFLVDETVTSDETLWWVPVSVAVKGSTDVQQVSLSKREDSVVVNVPSASFDGWIKFNVGQTGFYRTKYPSSMVQPLINAIKGFEIGPTDRLGVMNDAFALAKAGLLPTTDALRIASSFVNETDYTVWVDLTSNLCEVASVWANHECYPDLCRFALHLCGKIARAFPFVPSADEDSLTSLLRSLALRMAAHFGDQEIIDLLIAGFDDHKAGKTVLHPDLRSTAYRTAVSEGGEERYLQVLEIYRTADLHEEKVRALASLGAAKGIKNIRDILDFSLSSEVRSQDAFFPFRTLSDNKDAREPLWDFVREKWDELDRRFCAGNMNLIGRFISCATQSFTSDEKAKEVHAFFSVRNVPSAERTIAQSIEKIRLRAAWLKRDGEAVAQFVRDFKE